MMAVITLTKENYESEVLQSDKPVLIDFWAGWCGPCQMLSPIVDAVAEERDDIKVAKLNVDQEDMQEIVMLFDAYRVQNHRTEIFSYHNIHVVYTREAETADQYIEKFAHDNAKKHNVTVATSDGMEQIIIRGEGCRLLSARDFESEIRRAEDEMKEYL